MNNGNLIRQGKESLNDRMARLFNTAEKSRIMHTKTVVSGDGQSEAETRKSTTRPRSKSSSQISSQVSAQKSKLGSHVGSRRQQSHIGSRRSYATKGLDTKTPGAPSNISSSAYTRPTASVASSRAKSAKMTMRTSRTFRVGDQVRVNNSTAGAMNGQLARVENVTPEGRYEVRVIGDGNDRVTTVSQRKVQASAS